MHVVFFILSNLSLKEYLLPGTRYDDKNLWTFKR